MTRVNEVVLIITIYEKPSEFMNRSIMKIINFKMTNDEFITKKKEIEIITNFYLLFVLDYIWRNAKVVHSLVNVIVTYINRKLSYCVLRSCKMTFASHRL